MTDVGGHDLGAILKRIDKRLGVVQLTDRAASLAAGMSADCIRTMRRQWEAGKQKTATAVTLRMLARPLQTTVEWLMTGTGIEEVRGGPVRDHASDNTNAPSVTPLPSPEPGMLREVFTLEEGPVMLTCPAALSGESYRDLADHIGLFLRKSSRRAGSYYLESYEPKEIHAERHWTVSDGEAAIALVKEIIAAGKIARVRCPLQADPKVLQSLADLGAQRF